jgi:CheY-like chemotaxis protein
VKASDVETARPQRHVIGIEPGYEVDAEGHLYRLLVVEDKQTNRELLVKLLSSVGTPSARFEIHEASNGQEAIEIYKTWQPHLIWMDMGMPIMDGHEATKRIKATPQGQATIIVALTASAFEEEREVILAEGCDDFVRKPFREAEIFEVLERHLDIRFIYRAEDDHETEDVLEQGATPKVSKASLIPEALACLPAEWLAQLEVAAAQADAEVILKLLEHIQSSHPQLAAELKRLVHDFRFDIVVELITSVADAASVADVASVADAASVV